MSTTQQEPLVDQTTEPTEGDGEKESKEKDKASEREYVVLEQRTKDGPWSEVKRVEAGTVKEALDSLGDKSTATSSYVAVAERYWRPLSPTVETTTTVVWQ